MTKTSVNTAKKKLRRTSKSWTTRAAALAPVALAILVALQDAIPLLQDLLKPWTFVAISALTGIAVAVLRVRTEDDK